MTKDRCTRISELLLIENEVRKIESLSESIGITSDIEDILFNLELTPIEKIMYAILTRVATNLRDCYNTRLELFISPQEKIGKYIVDFLVTADFSDDKVIIECDGHDFHEKTKEQAQHDKERDRFFTSLGFKILRYTGSEIYNDFLSVEKQLSRLLDAPVGSSLFGEKRNDK